MDSGNAKSRRYATFGLGIVVVLMFGFGFAIAPLYSLFCEVTGIKAAATPTGVRAVAAVDAAAQAPVDRVVTVKFDTNVTDGLPWEFRPLVRRVEVRPGEPLKVSFAVRNLAAQTVVARAVANVVPWQATPYFSKTECFCFQEQTLAPGETREMAVRFLVSRDLPAGINSLTLSYTFMTRAPVSSPGARVGPAVGAGPQPARAFPVAGNQI